MKKHIFNLLLSSFAVLVFIAFLVGCKKTEIKQNTTDDVNIVGYLDKHLDSFSLFRQILDRTETADFLNAYGSYTCFAVTNTGVRTWLNSQGYASVEVADLNKLKNMIKFHLLSDTVSTGSFTDGKIPKVTMYGQFLIAGITTKYGVSSYLINRQGFILESNIKTGNGIIQVIDNVLKPASLTIAKTIEGDSRYSIFLQALKETKYFDSLNLSPAGISDTSAGWYTLIAEPNIALADSGITSYAQLKARYSQTGNPALVTDSLHLYMAYHIIPGIKFLGDVILSETQSTLAPQEVVTTKLVNKEVLVNDDDFNGVHEPGILLNRGTSDMAATNGVVHDAKSHFSLKFRLPLAVYWDVSSFSEIRKLPAYYRQQSYNFVKYSAEDKPIADIDWQFTNSSQFLSYSWGNTSSTTGLSCNGDVNTMIMGSTNRPTWYEYKTPIIVKGRYKVWVCYRRGGSANCDVIIDGTTLQRRIDFSLYLPSGTDGDREAIFYKRYISVENSGYAGRNVGIIDIATTGRHTLRFQAASGSSNTNWLDMIHFIPVNQNQILPRFAPDGSKVNL